MTVLMGTRKPRVVDFVVVGQQHAMAAWERSGQRLELVEVEPDPGALQSVYGLVSVEQWRDYRDTYRSTLHGLNLLHEGQQRRVRRLQGVG